jgi:nitrilase
MTRIRVAAAQAHPVWLDAAATTNKILSLLEQAAANGVQLLAFPETFLPGYPYWVMLGGVDRFNDQPAKAAYAAYVDAAVNLDGLELKQITAVVRDLGVFVYLGIAERAGTSVYATLVAIDPERGVVSAHRKLMPTYGERTVWAVGDGHGLRVHDVGEMLVGGLNCWENWMPLARHALYAAGEELHVAAWPGSAAMTADIARLIALEGRVWVLLASGLLAADDVPSEFPYYQLIANKPAGFYNGGSCIAAPDGTWAVAPTADEERLLIADVDRDAVRRARQTFDPAGHYSRHDVFDVRVNRRRLGAVAFLDD